MQTQTNRLSITHPEYKKCLLLFQETLQNKHVLCLFFCNAPTFLAHQETILNVFNNLNAASNHYSIYQHHKKTIVSFNENLLKKQTYKTYLLDPKKTKKLPDFDSKYHLLLFSDCLDPNTLLFSTLKQKNNLSIIRLPLLFPNISYKNQRIGNPKEHILLNLNSSLSKKKYNLITQQLQSHQKTMALHCSSQILDV